MALSSVVVMVERDSLGTADERFSSDVREGRAETAMNALTMDLELRAEQERPVIIGAGEMTAGSVSGVEVRRKRTMVINAWVAAGRPDAPLILGVHGRQR